MMDTTLTDVDGEETELYQQALEDDEVKIDDETHAIISVQAIGRGAEIHTVEVDQELRISSAQPASIKVVTIASKLEGD